MEHKAERADEKEMHDLSDEELELVSGGAEAPPCPCGQQHKPGYVPQ